MTLNVQRGQVTGMQLSTGQRKPYVAATPAGPTRRRSGNRRSRSGNAAYQSMSPEMSMMLRRMIAEEKSKDKYTQLIVTRLLLPVSGYPLRLPGGAERTSVSSMRFAGRAGIIGLNPINAPYEGVNQFFMSTITNTTNYAGALVFTGRPGCPYMCTEAIASATYIEYNVTSYDPVMISQPDATYVGSTAVWTITPQMIKTIKDIGVAGAVIPVGDIWNIHAATATEEVSNSKKLLHGKYMPVGYSDTTDVLFLQTGDTLTITGLASKAATWVNLGGTATGASIVADFEVHRLDGRNDSTIVYTFGLKLNAVSATSGTVTADVTSKFDLVVPSSFSRSGAGHYFVKLATFYVTPSAITDVDGWWPPITYSVKMKPGVTGLRWSLQTNPLIDLSQRGNPELGRDCRTTAASILIPASSASGASSGSIRAFRCRWDDAGTADSLTTAGDSQSFNMLSGVYTYKTYDPSADDYSEACFGYSPVYDARYCGMAHVLVFVMGSTTGAITPVVELALESRGPTVHGNLGASKMTRESLESALTLISSRGDFFMENPEHLAKLWAFLKQATSAIWAGAKVVAPYVPPLIAPVNPELALLADALARLSGLN